MSILDLFVAQLMDPFRIALLIGLLVTSANTSAAMNQTVPLALGVLFVAVVIPTAFGPSALGLPLTIIVGVAANLVILGVLLLIKMAIVRFRSGS